MAASSNHAHAVTDSAYEAEVQSLWDHFGDTLEQLRDRHPTYQARMIERWIFGTQDGYPNLAALPHQELIEKVYADR